MTHIKAQPPSLTSHSDYLSELAGQISQAAGKGDNVSFGVDSFGLVGQAFALLARESSQQAVDQIRTFAERTDELGQAVRECADAYTAEDDRQAACLSEIKW